MQNQFICLPYRRFVIGRTLLAGGIWQVENLRYSGVQRSRNQIVIVLLLVLVLDCPISEDENEDDDEDERFARPRTIWTDTDRLQVCATGAASTLNTYSYQGGEEGCWPDSEIPLPVRASRGEGEDQCLPQQRTDQ